MEAVRKTYECEESQVGVDPDQLYNQHISVEAETDDDEGHAEQDPSDSEQDNARVSDGCHSRARDSMRNGEEERELQKRRPSGQAGAAGYRRHHPAFSLVERGHQGHGFI